jgi:hypothetical protein
VKRISIDETTRAIHSRALCTQLHWLARVRDAPIAAKAAVRFLAAVIATILLVAILLHDLDLARGDFAVATAHVEAQTRETLVFAIAFFMEGKTYSAQ